MKKIFAFFVVGLLPWMAVADQCAYVSQEIADNAMKILQKTDNYIDFCALCEDSFPIKIDIKSVEYKKVKDHDLYELYINDKPIDLAYTYIQDINLGVKLKCSETLTGVPEHLQDYLNEIH